MKKEELIAENAKLGLVNQEFSEADIRKRKELSKMLNAPLKKKNMYDYEDEQVIYSWSEIYFNLGKLMANKYFNERISNEKDTEPIFLTDDLKNQIKSNKLCNPNFLEQSKMVN